MSKKRNKSPIDRTTRLVATLTISSGVAILAKIIISTWINTFSTSAYAKNLVNFEYIISILSVTIIVLFIFSIGKYLFFEMKTFIYFETDNDQIRAFVNADNAFKSIFTVMKICINFVFAVMMTVTIIEFLQNKYSWKFLLLGIGIGVISFLGLLLINKEKLKNLINLKEGLEQKISQYFTFAFVGLLIFLIGITITLVSLSSNGKAKISIEESTNIPILIEIENSLESELYIYVINSKGKKSVVTSEMEVVSSYIEVIEKNKELKSQKDVENFINNLNKEIDKMNIPNSKYSQKYTMDLGNYIIEGKNEIEVILFSGGTSNSKAIHFGTTVIRDGNNIRIAEKDIELNL